MTQQDNETKDLLTIGELAAHAMAEADKEAEERDADQPGADSPATDDDSATEDDDNVHSGDEESKANADAESHNADEDKQNPDGKGKKASKGKGNAEDDKDVSLSERLRQYVDDDDAQPFEFKVSLKAIVGGDGLSKVVARNWLLITVTVFFTCCYVTSRYMMQGAILERNSLNRQLEDRKIKALTVTSEYLEKTRKDFIESNLADSTLQQSVDVPYSLPVN